MKVKKLWLYSVTLASSLKFSWLKTTGPFGINFCPVQNILSLICFLEKIEISIKILFISNLQLSPFTYYVRIIINRKSPFFASKRWMYPSISPTATKFLIETGEVSFLSDKLATASVKTISSAKILIWKQKRLKRICKRFPQTDAHLKSLLGVQLAEKFKN